MKLLVDMNLSPHWVEVFAAEGWDAVHWSTIGDPRADDSQIMAVAVAKGWVVFTHDLDFGALLALTHAGGPSVIQVRAQNITPAAMSGLVINALHQFRSQLESGALVVVDEARIRARILPLSR